jgi:hypothetical protein
MGNLADFRIHPSRCDDAASTALGHDCARVNHILAITQRLVVLWNHVDSN